MYNSKKEIAKLRKQVNELDTRYWGLKWDTDRKLRALYTHLGVARIETEKVVPIKKLVKEGSKEHEEYKERLGRDYMTRRHITQFNP